MAAQKKKVTKNYTVKQVYHTSAELDARMQKYCEAKGVKTPTLSIIAVNDFLTNNNF